MIRVERRAGCKIKIIGRDKAGKNTTFGITVADCDATTLKKFIEDAIDREAQARYGNPAEPKEPCDEL